VVEAERPGSVLGERVAVAFAVGGAHKSGCDLEIPLADLRRLAPQLGQPKVDIELEQVDAAGSLWHTEKS